MSLTNPLYAIITTTADGAIKILFIFNYRMIFQPADMSFRDQMIECFG